MTNKPMLSVERELLEAMHSHPGCPVEFIDHLRRAISQPAGNAFKRCTILKECNTRASATTTAAQRQGVVTLEQVLKAYDYANLHPHKYLRGTTNWCAAVAHSLNEQKPAIKLYLNVSNVKVTVNADGSYTIDPSEQPAPTADHTQCEECKGWGYHENHHEGGGTECGECGGSGNATVAVAVVMPDRQIVPDNLMAGLTRKWCEGWNDALEEVARLNGVKP